MPEHQPVNFLGKPAAHSAQVLDGRHQYWLDLLRLDDVRGLKSDQTPRLRVPVMMQWSSKARVRAAVSVTGLAPVELG